MSEPLPPPAVPSTMLRRGADASCTEAPSSSVTLIIGALADGTGVVKDTRGVANDEMGVANDAVGGVIGVPHVMLPLRDAILRSVSIGEGGQELICR